MRPAERLEQVERLGVAPWPHPAGVLRPQRREAATQRRRAAKPVHDLGAPLDGHAAVEPDEAVAARPAKRLE